MARDSLWRRRRGAPEGWVRTQRRCVLPQTCVAGSRSPPQLRPQRPPGPVPAPPARRAASAAAAATRGRSRRPPAATARRGGLVSCGSCAAAAATRGRRRRAPCTPAAAPGAPTRARPRAFAAARAARGSGRSRTPTTPASLPAAHTLARLSASGGFGLAGWREGGGSGSRASRCAALALRVSTSAITSSVSWSSSHALHEACRSIRAARARGVSAVGETFPRGCRFSPTHPEAGRI